MCLWMAVTVDNYELPIYIEESAEELAQKLGIRTTVVKHLSSKRVISKKNNMRLIKIEIDEGEE